MNAYGCQNIANPNYRPNSLDESLLLWEQNNFMYDVFETILQTTMTSLTSLRLSQNYRGTTQKFLIDWLDKIMQYEKLTPLEAHFTPTVKKAML